jgi:hypothetical protein
MARQNIDELIALKKRSGRRGGRFPSGFDIMRLRDAWASSTDPKELFASLLPARVVTLIEVFCRYWVQRLIDQGAPYDERAIDLKINIKYDLPLIRSLHGQTISLGFLISNNVPLSSIETIGAIFSALLHTDFFRWLSNARRRKLLEHEPDGGGPIVADIDKLKRTLARIFEVRHILIHEFPEKSPFEIAEIGEMLDAADNFIIAADEGLSQLLFGLYPITQQGMNSEAREECKSVVDELDRLADDVARKSNSDTILKVQQAWRAFAEAEADRTAEGFTGGTAYPLFFHGALKELASDRLRQLRTWVDGQDMLEE